MSKIFIILCLILCIFVAGCVNSSEIKNTTHPSMVDKDVIQVKYFTTKNYTLCQKTDDLLSNLSVKYPVNLLLHIMILQII